MKRYDRENDDPMRIWSNYVGVPHEAFEFMANISDLSALRCYIVLVHEFYYSGKRTLPVEDISELSKLDIVEVYKGMIWLENNNFLIDGKLLYYGEE